MMIKLGNDRGNDPVDIAFTNVDGGGSITNNLPVCFTVDGNSVGNGKAMHSRTVNFPGFVGISRDNVAINGWGRSRLFGTIGSLLISNETTSITITAGEVLTLVNGLGLGMSSVGGVTLSYQNMKYCVITQTLTLSQGSVTADNALVMAL